MKKKFLGIICLLYTAIIIYVKIANTLKNFLAPNMQNHLMYSSIPLLIIGIILINDEHSHYKFKMSDLILLLPVVMLIFAGNGKLTTTFATNRTMNIKKQINTNKKVVKEHKKDFNIKDYDMSTINFDIVDESYNSLVDYFNSEPKAEYYEGSTIRIRGFAVKKDSYLPKGYFFLGKYSISCCAADAGYLGIMAKYDTKKIKEDTWYEIEGVLRKGKNNQKMDTMYVHVVNIRKISKSSEEAYIYPCYNYGDGNCTEVTDYNLKYY